MSSSTPTMEEIAIALKTYECTLRERNEVLAELARISREMRTHLQSEGPVDIRHALERRELQCRKYAALCARQTMSDETMIRRAEEVARSGDRNFVPLGLSVLGLYEDAQDMADEIMTCQAECETMLRNRLQATSQALRQSAQRRKLDAVYGPAHRHDVPMFMDRRK